MGPSGFRKRDLRTQTHMNMFACTHVPHLSPCDNLHGPGILPARSPQLHPSALDPQICELNTPLSLMTHLTWDTVVNRTQMALPPPPHRQTLHRQQRSTGGSRVGSSPGDCPFSTPGQAQASGTHQTGRQSASSAAPGCQRHRAGRCPGA